MASSSETARASFAKAFRSNHVASMGRTIIHISPPLMAHPRPGRKVTYLSKGARFIRLCLRKRDDSFVSHRLERTHPHRAVLQGKLAGLRPRQEQRDPRRLIEEEIRPRAVKLVFMGRDLSVPCESGNLPPLTEEISTGAEFQFSCVAATSYSSIRARPPLSDPIARHRCPCREGSR